MRLLAAAALFLSVAACNPGTRCSKAADCPVNATCSGGFCADYHAPGGNPAEVVDSDADAGSVDGGTRPDGGPLDDGR